MVPVDEFIGWLAKGLGRPTIFLKKNDPGPYKEALLFACTHCLIYDSQCEETREEYLMRLIRLCGDPGYFRNGILTTLASGPEEDRGNDFRQTLDLAGLFALQGDGEMKQAMYDAVAHTSLYFCRPLIKLDGLPALLIAAELFPPPRLKEEWWQIGSLIYELEDRDGKAAVAEALVRAAAAHPALAELLTAHEDFCVSSAPWARIPPRDYPELKQMIEERGISTPVRQWSERASREDLALAAEDLLKQPWDGARVAYLQIFWRRPFPLSPQYLIDLASGESKRVARAAIRALSQIASPEVRAFGLSLMETPDRPSDGVELLARNYQPGDFERIDRLFQKSTTDWKAHSLGFAVGQLFDVELHPEAENALLWLYEHDPCSMCRTKFVKHLVALNRIPDWMREEIRYDTESETRALA